MKGFSCILIALAATLTHVDAVDRKPEPINLLLITIDTLRPDHLGCYGYARNTTPNLDALAARSVRFANAMSTTSWTLPAHASLLTGLYPAELGMHTGRHALPPSAPTLQAVLSERGYDTFAVTSHIYLGPRWGFDRGWDGFDGSAGHDSAHRPVAGAVVERGLRWLSGRSGSKRPFFMWLHIFDPHWDYSPPPPLDRLFDPDYAGKMTGDYESLRPYIKNLVTEAPPALGERDLRHLLALYDGEIRYADREIGRLLDALRRYGLFDSTLIAVTSDHGEEFMEHGSLEGHQWTLHDEVVRVPLLIKLPGNRHAGRVVGGLVSIVGLPGTLLRGLGADTEWRNFGASFPRRLSSNAPPVLLDLTVRGAQRHLGIQTEGFKLLRLPGGRELLFTDRAEQEDVAARHPRVVTRLSRRIDRLLAGMEVLDDAGAARQPLERSTIKKLKALGYTD